MSGGSYDYMFGKVHDEYVGRMLDPELDAMIEDLVPVLKAVEWYTSGDIGEESYREKALEFKKKWLRGGNVEVVSNIVARKFADLKDQLMLIWRSL